MTGSLKFNVEISVPTGGVREAFAKVAEGIEQLAEQMTRQTGKLKGGFDFTKIMSHFRSLAQALGYVKNKLDEAVGASLSWDKEVNGLARTLGVTTKEAGGLANALSKLGSDTGAYTGAVFSLQQSLMSQEDALNANGEMLDIQQVMMNTLERLRNMKPGYNANALAVRQHRRRVHAHRGGGLDGRLPTSACACAGINGHWQRKIGNGDLARRAFAAAQRQGARGVFYETWQCRCSNHRHTQRP
jgi:hypothetical protein